MISILIVDDHPMVRQGLAAFVASSGDLRLLGQAASAAEALTLYRQLRPDVVLMDMVMPEVDGPTGIAQIRAEFPNAVVIALTSFGEEHLIARALQAGARGFLYKTIGISELVDAVRQVAQGRTILDPKASQVLLRLLSGTFILPETELSKPKLSDGERQVLGYLSEGLTNKQIAARMRIRPSTVKQYLVGLFNKLQVRSRAEAVATAMKMGLFEK